MKFVKRLVRKINARFPRAQRGSGPVVRLISITSVKNEQDIIEPFLRTNAPFFDAMIIIDNASTDRTRDIAVSCASELGGIFVTDSSSFDNLQSKTLTNALRYVQAAFFADFVCFLDADEFIGASSRAHLLDALAPVRVGTCSLHDWQTFLPDPDLPFSPGIDPLHRLTLRRRSENPVQSKVFLRMGGGINPTLTVRRGAHSVEAGDGKKLAVMPIPGVPLRHLPVRNLTQMKAKAVLGWMGNLAVDPTLATRAIAKMSTSFQWKRIYDLAQNPEALITTASLSDEAMVYAQHENPPTFADNAEPADPQLDLTRIYSDGHSGNYSELVAPANVRSGKRPPVFAVSPPENMNKVKSDVATAFDSDWHWGHIYFDAAPFRDFIDRHQPNSVFDVGCGKGLYLRFLNETGVNDVFGVDGIEPSVTVLGQRQYQQVDLHLPFDAGRRFDVVFCLEVAEHLAPDVTDTLLDTISRHADKRIVFSMAELGQPGHGHINCRPMNEVLDMWRRRGWVPDLVETLGFRALSTLAWFRRNIVILKHVDTGDDDSAAQALCRIAALKYNWPGQHPGIYNYAFEAPYPEAGAAYGKVLPRR